MPRGAATDGTDNAAMVIERREARDTRLTHTWYVSLPCLNVSTVKPLEPGSAGAVAL
jgi:hypothetical protein